RSVLQSTPEIVCDSGIRFLRGTPPQARYRKGIIGEISSIHSSGNFRLKMFWSLTKMIQGRAPFALERGPTSGCMIAKSVSNYDAAHRDRENVRVRATPGLSLKTGGLPPSARTKSVAAAPTAPFNRSLLACCTGSPQALSNLLKLRFITPCVARF